MIWRDKIKPGRNQDWHRCFAWLPVCVTLGLNPYPATYVWLELVERRWLVFEYLTPNRWEYRQI